jgi:hypothetical protein
MQPKLTGLKLRKAACEVLGYEWWSGYGKTYLVPQYLGDEWRAHPGLGWKPGKVGTESEIDMDFMNTYQHAALPRVESEPAISEEMFSQWAWKSDLQWQLETAVTYDDVKWPLYTVTILRDLGEGRLGDELFIVEGSTPSEARARAIVESVK